MSEQMSNEKREDRIEALKKRIILMKEESVDWQFDQFLDQVMYKLKSIEDNFDKTEQHLEKSYQLYLQRNGLANPAMPQQPMQQEPVPVQSNPQPVMQFDQPVMEPNQPVMQSNQSVQIPQPAFNVAPPKKDNKTLEFKVGTFVLGVVGILFLLIAFVSFGLQYMSTTFQGILFYTLGIAIFAFSECYLAKRLEKFSYFLSGLGMSGLYITTILNYLYLKIFSSWVALIITIIITAFFFWLSYKKDSGMMRIICLLGCYVSLIPIGDLQSLSEFAIPAVIIFVLNLAGFFCPLKSKSGVADYVQYGCTISLLLFMNHLLSASDLATWPLYILVCGSIMTLHLICLKQAEKSSYQVLYIIGNVIFVLMLLTIGERQPWVILGTVAVALMCAVFMFVYRKTRMRFAPYILAICYMILAFAIEGDDFNLYLVCLIVFVVNRIVSAFMDGFEMPDAIYTMLAAVIVCFDGREGEVQAIGYAFAAAIIVGAFFVKKYKRYHMYTAVTFAWIFLLTEDMYPLACSVLICVLSAAMIGYGFIKKEKPLRIYGLCLMIFVALKLVCYDFVEAEAFTKIIVFMVTGLVILGVSFLYIYLEKKQLAEEQELPGN